LNAGTHDAHLLYVADAAEQMRERKPLHVNNYLRSATIKVLQPLLSGIGLTSMWSMNQLTVNDDLRTVAAQWLTLQNHEISQHRRLKACQELRAEVVRAAHRLEQHEGSGQEQGEGDEQQQTPRKRSRKQNLQPSPQSPGLTTRSQAAAAQAHPG
jgi:hypothetical protein